MFDRGGRGGGARGGGVKTLLVLALLCPSTLMAQGRPGAPDQTKHLWMGAAVSTGVGIVSGKPWLGVVVNTTAWMTWELANAMSPSNYVRVEWTSHETAGLALGVAGGVVGYVVSRWVTRKLFGWSP